MKNYSQNNEQEIILHHIQKVGMVSGKLLEIGAFDGELFSNTRAIMLEYPEWKGSFVEASSFPFTKLYELYKDQPNRVDLINLAVVCDDDLGKTPLLAFHESPMCTVSSSIPNHGEKYGYQTRPIWVGRTGMRDILETFGPFDFINIDVEGYSAKLALQNWFNPKDYGCKMICVEQDGMWKELQQKFSGHGYSTIAVNAENIIMVAA